MVWLFAQETLLRLRVSWISSVFSNCYLFSPPHPIKKFYYRCDRKFHLDDLLKLYETHENYAIVLVSGKRTEFYLYNINETKYLKGLDMDLPNQHKTGGQSAPRFGRIRDEKIGLYIKKIIELMIQLYVRDGIFQCQGMVLAGPAEMKDSVKNHDLYIQYFSRHLLKMITVPEIIDNTIYQVIQLSADVLISDTEEKRIIQKFENMLTDKDLIDLLLFGRQETMAAFAQNQLKEMLICEESTLKDYVLKDETKTKIYVIKTKEFTSKYGELVGIKYYA